MSDHSSKPKTDRAIILEAAICFFWNGLAGVLPVSIALMTPLADGINVDLTAMIVAPVFILAGNVWKIGQRIYDLPAKLGINAGQHPTAEAPQRP